MTLSIDAFLSSIHAKLSGNIIILNLLTFFSHRPVKNKSLYLILTIVTDYPEDIYQTIYTNSEFVLYALVSISTRSNNRNRSDDDN